MKRYTENNLQTIMNDKCNKVVRSKADKSIHVLILKSCIVNNFNVLIFSIIKENSVNFYLQPNI